MQRPWWVLTRLRSEGHGEDSRERVVVMGPPGVAGRGRLARRGGEP
jgi:hypothetical protein